MDKDWFLHFPDADFVVFWSVSFPLGSVLKHFLVESRVNDFVEFVFLFSFYLHSWRGFVDLCRESVFLVRFEEGDVECVVYSQ